MYLAKTFVDESLYYCNLLCYIKCSTSLLTLCNLQCVYKVEASVYINTVFKCMIYSIVQVHTYKYNM